MLKQIKKISKDVKAFTLTEVMIGMMILTVAIVSASNLLTGIIDSNRNNLTTLQAYYLSQEGLEIVRNIRDTNWLHNKDWLGNDKDSMQIWGGKLIVGKNDNIVNVVDAAGTKSFVKQDSPDFAKAPTSGEVRAESPWEISSGAGKIYRHGMLSVDKPFLDSNVVIDGDTGFKRTIGISQYDCSYLSKYSVNLCVTGKFILVQSKIDWNIGAKPRSLVLSEVLTNWKGGAL
ncbi:MAG: prepilin-type N-terminal cleavage/methylation domain-containing protein [Candidatus Peregrinibacteria bacterium]|nr:prepilin-type N-terminal cleavage/methylation domain-containing protein [Candidatus Peregrinibacteria bacterium]